MTIRDKFMAARDAGHRVRRTESGYEYAAGYWGVGYPEWVPFSADTVVTDRDVYEGV